MSKKFPYGYDINKYLDKAFDLIKETFFWVRKDMFDERYEYDIEKEGNRYEYIVYYTDQDGEKTRRVLDWCKKPKDFYNIVKSDNEYKITSYNPIKETFKVPIDCGKDAGGWYLERYEFSSHEQGGYSVFVQAGDRVTGGSRTFYIPQDYFKGTYDEFLDKYVKLVYPRAFGMSREDLDNTKGLKEFLGFKE